MSEEGALVPGVLSCMNLPNLGDCDPLQGIDDQHLRDNVLALGRKVLRKYKHSRCVESKRERGQYHPCKHEIDHSEREMRQGIWRYHLTSNTQVIKCASWLNRGIAPPPPPPLIARRTSNLDKEIRHAIIIERQPSTEQSKENHSAAPDVDLSAGIHPAHEPISDYTMGLVSLSSCSERERESGRIDVLSRDDLGCGVVRRAAAGRQEVAVAHQVRQAKVGDLDLVVVREQQVLGLEVAVHHHVSVAVLDARDDLLHDLASFVLRQLCTE